MSKLCEYGGYIMTLQPTHPRADSCGYVREHILILEKALGRSLPIRAESHHVNRIRNDNRNCNLVLCENRAYHMLLHQRQRAVEAGYPANWVKCTVCKIYDRPSNLRVSPIKRRSAYHLVCKSAQALVNYHKRRKRGLDEAVATTII